MSLDRVSCPMLCTWIKKRIERTAKRLILGAVHRGLQFLNSLKNKAKNV